MAYVVRSGAHVAYEDTGAGWPVVLVHGFPFSRRMWEPQKPLARIVRLITPDLRGFGESEGTPSSLDELADDVHAVVESLHLGPFALAGFSMGGYVLFRYMARHAASVNALLLLDTRAEADTPDGRQRRYDGIARIEREGPAGYLDDFLKLVVSAQALASRPDLLSTVRGQMESQRIGSLTAALRAMAERPDSTPVLSSIRVPTLIVVGEEDRATPVSSAKTMHEAIRGSRLVIIPDAGHVSNLEQPARFNAALGEFLQTVPLTPRP